jgi:hemerythrin
MRKSMLYIVWSDSNNTGIPIIDEQHRGIVATINSFHYFSQKGHGLDALKPTFVILEQYTDIHFKTEESLMYEAKYSAVDAHIVYHRELMKKTLAVVHDPALYGYEDAVLKFLKDWWLSHTNKEDGKYAPDIRKMLGL